MVPDIQVVFSAVEDISKTLKEVERKIDDFYKKKNRAEKKAQSAEDKAFRDKLKNVNTVIKWEQQKAKEAKRFHDQKMRLIAEETMATTKQFAVIDSIMERSTRKRLRNEERILKARRRASEHMRQQAVVQRSAMMSGTLAAMPFIGPVMAAIETERVGAEIRKAGKFAPGEFQNFMQDFLGRARGIPLGFEEQGKVMAALAKTSVPKEEMARYGERLMKASFALDMSAEETAFKLDKVQTNMAVTTEQTKALMDKLNALSNTVGSRMPGSVEILERMSGTFGEMEVGQEQLAAIVGYTDKVSRTARLGASGLDMFFKAFRKNPAAWKMLRKDPIQVMQAVAKQLAAMDEGARQRVILDVFGTEQGVVQFVNQLVKNPELLTSALKTTSDRMKTLNSVGKESAEMLQTTDAKMKMFREQVRQAGSAIGDSLLPALNALLEDADPVLMKFSEFAKQNPDLMKWVIGGGIAAAVTAITVAATKFTALTLGANFVSMITGIQALAGSSFIASFGALLVNPWVLGAAALAAFSYGVWKLTKILFPEFAASAENYISGAFEKVSNFIGGTPTGMAVSAAGDAGAGVTRSMSARSALIEAQYRRFSLQQAEMFGTRTGSAGMSGYINVNLGMPEGIRPMSTEMSSSGGLNLGLTY